jgi:hypothetical protein
MMDMHRRIRGLLCALFALALAAQPCIAWSDAAVARGAPKQLRSTLPGELSARHLTVLGVRVGNDGLAAVQGRVGEAVAFSPESAPELVTTCFVDADDRSLAVMFQAHRYDPTGRLTMAFIGAPSAMQTSVRRCQPRAGLAEAAATASGIYLGMSRDEFAQQFPYPPSERGNRLLGYYFYQPLPDGGCQLLSGVRAQFDGYGLSALTVYRLYRGPGC